MPTPAAVRKSMANPDHLVSFVDGKPYKTFKRHLAVHELTPNDYRRRYNLPNDYPMIAPAYSARRSAIAKSMQLGRKAVKKPGTRKAQKSSAKRR